ncbi:MAG TPA: hypothetical protein PK395_05075, partial [bacterium]|nr:hypothetical protein [bacterium]HQP97844.1 hypothetical protein [bacterium]
MSKGAATMGRSLRWFVVACAVMGVLSAVGMSTAWGAPLPRENESVAPWFLPLQENVDGVPAPGLVHSTVADASAILAASPTAYLASTSKGRVDDGEDGFINATATGASNPGNGLGGTYSPIYRWLAKTTSGAGAMIANLQPGDTLVMAAVVANVSSASVARLQAGTLSSTEYAGLLQGVTADFYTPYNTAVAGAYQVFSPTYTEINPSSATGVTKDVKDATLVVFLWDGSAQGTALNAVNPALLVVPATATTTGTGADTNGLRAVVQLVGGRTVNSNYVGFDLNGPVFEDAMIVGAVGPDGKSVGMIDRRLKQTGYTVIPTNAVSEIRSGDTLIVDATFVVRSEWDGEPDAYFGANTDELVDAYSTYIPNIGDPDGSLAATFLRQANDIDVKAFSTTLPAAVPVDKPGDFLVTGAGTPVTTPPIANGEPGVWLGFRDGGGLSQEYLNTNWIATGAAGKIVMRATFVVTDASTVAYANGALTVDGGPDTGHNA